MKETIEGRKKYVLDVLAVLINNTCTEYAKDNLTEDDLQEIEPASEKVLDVTVINKEERKVFTLKPSSMTKYENLYDEKLVKMFENLEK